MPFVAWRDVKNHLAIQQDSWEVGVERKDVRLHVWFIWCVYHKPRIARRLWRAAALALTLNRPKRKR